MNDYVIYHNPRCSKSRTALEMLRQHQIEPRVIEYLKTPPTVAELQGVLAKLGLPPAAILRAAEPEYAQLQLGRPDLSDAAVLDAIARHPILLQRPIVVHGARAVIGRPPEKVLALL